MSMDKQPVNINFSRGINTKVDPWQIPIGEFARLKNSVFDKGGLMKKRNGYFSLPDLPNTTYSYLTTFKENLTALGPSIASLSESLGNWTVKGTIQPMKVSTAPLIRNNLNQSQVDSVTAANGLLCTVYTETNSTTSNYKYAIIDSSTGQNIIAPTLIPPTTGTITGSPRVFLLGTYFVVVFTNVISGTSHLQYISISSASPTTVTTNHDIASAYISAPTVSWDGVVFNNQLFIAYNTTSGGQAIKITYLTISQAAQGTSPVTATTFSSSIATMMSLCVDATVNNPLVYLSFYDSAGSTGYVAAVNTSLTKVLNATQIISSGTYLNLASVAHGGSVTVFEEKSNNYSYDATVPSHFINKVSVTSAGSVGSTTVVIRSVGLGSKAFILDSVVYFLAAFQSPFQPTYFLVNASTSTAAAPVIVGKLAYENGGGYLTLGLPGVSISDSSVSIPYLFKDFVQGLTVANNTQQSTTGGVYSQTGTNLGTFNFTSDGIDTVEIGNNLHLSGGFLGLYDGYLPVEHNFFLWPDSIEVSTNASAVVWTGDVATGSNVISNLSSMVGIGLGASVTGTAIPANQFITAFDRVNSTATFGPLVATGTHVTENITVTGNAIAQQYYYQVIYQWPDNQGNIHNSAGSVPVAVTTTGANSTNAISFPYLRLTMKTANPVKAIVYRWSAAQPVYHQITSITAPLLNSTTVDSFTLYDSYADTDIQGNSIIYTAGGAVEDVNAPATNIMTLFDTRVWLVDAEDPNLLWYSKQIIEATPIEMSDLLTLYIAPNIGTTSTTGPITALAPMDDKLIIFKRNAIYYIGGTGPDNTGSNSQYSQPIFVTSTVGCVDQASIVLMNDGLMFQSDKGIWLLSRGLAVSYIGAPVDDFNASVVNSANNIPTVNQIRSTLDTGQTLLYDYYYSQWGTFEGVPAVSSSIYDNKHTFIDSYGKVYKETASYFQDGSNPVVMGFTTGWINLAAIQGFQRLYSFYLIGKYYSPHKLLIQVAYNYNESVLHSTVITPNNFSASSASPFGDQPAPFGSPIDLEQWKIDAKLQKCQSFKLIVDEIYDPSFGIRSGAGLTISGINMMVLVKRATRPLRASDSAGLR